MGLQAPEAVQTGIYSRATDIYSLGIMIWEMIEAAEPFEGDITALKLIVCGTLRPQFTKSKYIVPKRLERLAVACWSQVPKLRPTVADVLSQLQVVLEDAVEQEANAQSQDKESGRGDTEITEGNAGELEYAVSSGRLKYETFSLKDSPTEHYFLNDQLSHILSE